MRSARIHTVRVHTERERERERDESVCERERERERRERRETHKLTRTQVLCDLAGSERLSKTEATGTRLKEAQSINKVCVCVCVCISACVRVCVFCRSDAHTRTVGHARAHAHMLPVLVNSWQRYVSAALEGFTRTVQRFQAHLPAAGARLRECVRVRVIPYRDSKLTDAVIIFGAPIAQHPHSIIF